jgi:hypothetical protein
MPDHRWRRPPSPRAQEPLKTLFQLFFAYLPLHTKDNVSFLIEERRSGNGKSHPQPIEVVASCAKPHWEAYVMLTHKGRDLFSALCVIQ